MVVINARSSCSCTFWYFHPYFTLHNFFYTCLCLFLFDFKSEKVALVAATNLMMHAKPVGKEHQKTTRLFVGVAIHKTAWSNSRKKDESGEQNYEKAEIQQTNGVLYMYVPRQRLVTRAKC